MSSSERSEYPSAASSLHRRSILISALSARSRSVWGFRVLREGFLGRPGFQNILFASQLASPSSMSAALRGISCYLKEVRRLPGTSPGGRW